MPCARRLHGCAPGLISCEGHIWQLAGNVGGQSVRRVQWHFWVNHSEDKSSCAFC